MEIVRVVTRDALTHSNDRRRVNLDCKEDCRWLGNHIAQSLRSGYEVFLTPLDTHDVSDRRGMNTVREKLDIHKES